jgi:malonyl-CoA O-methyltransferase
MDAAVLSAIVPELAGLRVVEAGCGTGKNTGWLAERCLWLAALDFSAGMMAVARRKVQAGNVGWARCDLNRPWPLVGESADLVMFNLVLEHVQRLEPVFAQAARVLRVGGAMVLSEFHAVRLAESLMGPSMKGAQITGEAGEVLEFVGSFRHTAEEFEQAAGAVGLRLVESREWWEEGDERPLLLTMRFEKG